MPVDIYLKPLAQFICFLNFSMPAAPLEKKKQILILSILYSNHEFK
jgi:hypothetical protein